MSADAVTVHLHHRRRFVGRHLFHEPHRGRAASKLFGVRCG